MGIEVKNTAFLPPIHVRILFFLFLPWKYRIYHIMLFIFQELPPTSCSDQYRIEEEFKSK